MNALVDYLQREWATIAAAPATFTLALLLVFGIAYAVSRWYHGGVIELLNQRLIAKDQQISEYRERLHLAPSDGSSFSKLSHKELQAEALKFVSLLREWVGTSRMRGMQRLEENMAAMKAATSDERRQSLWDAQGRDSLRTGAQFINEYETRFKVKAIVLRDELLSRVKDPLPQSEGAQPYNFPTNQIGAGMVADDLERLAHLLQ